MHIHTKLTQEVQEATDRLRKILANTQDLLEHRRSLQRDLLVSEPVSDIDDIAEVS